MAKPRLNTDFTNEIVKKNSSGRPIRICEIMSFGQKSRWFCDENL